ncbi:GntR family transcriptional regulator [Variovorax sp. Sphag1AA]|uniref:GntR family transcriptional regulator n=1 Tax=Variovorax sp. Sphag1AA TaxID=2587027 RepID=UPI00161A2BDE|nr:GntR family transcriptional regulator [Variovorax sp. Sphag1AA]MBB3181335.1 GntR family transcriptional regulator [Variovorax sp. Sphag1AA]
MQTESAKPNQRLFESVRARVLDRLRSGEWSPGDRIPTEAQLASEFDVGIGTIRRAVEDLVAQGVLIRRARRGTTVAKHTDDHSFDLYFSFVDEAGEPLKLSAQMLGFKKERASPDVSRALRLPQGARVARIDNLRLLDQTPLMVDRIWIPLDRFADLSASTFAARRSSIYRFYQEHYGISVVRVVENLGACVADEALAEPLGIAVGDPLLHIQRTAFTYNDTPIEFRDRYVNSVGCKYQNVRGLQD